MNVLQFFIPGTPAPGGSKRGFALKKAGIYTGRIAMVDAGGQRTKDWRQSCVVVAQANTPPELLRGPLKVDFIFIMPRPKKHFHTSKAKNGQLREDAPKWHTNKPDLTKISRSTEDALTSIVWADDAQIVDSVRTKRYGDKPGCEVTVNALTEGDHAAMRIRKVQGSDQKLEGDHQDNRRPAVPDWFRTPEQTQQAVSHQVAPPRSNQS